jgi:poly(3-hydroxybutyrate) depolymerase
MPGMRTRVSGRALAMAAAVLVASCGGDGGRASAGERLEPLPVAADTVTVSGASAGGYMAVQFHVANSSLVQGAGVFAAGPYDCARGSVGTALGSCMKGEPPIAAEELVAHTSRLALDGAIDGIAGLSRDRVWIFRGASDAYVGKPVVDALEAYYRALVEPAGVARVELEGAGHTVPGRGDGLPACSATEPPFVGDCDYDGARVMLEHLYGAFAAATSPGPGRLRTFAQRPYAQAAGAVGLADEGWVYVPEACGGTGLPGRCRLHVVFHGCRQGASFIGDEFIRRSGYLAAADAGNVVLLFPQVAPSMKPLNPMGCWDWWGYGAANYATRSGPQVMAVRAMVDDLLGAAAEATTIE